MEQKIETKEDKRRVLHGHLLASSLEKYFRNPEKLAILREIVEGNSDISLRLLDFFVSTYCRQHTIVLDLGIDIHAEYRMRLKAYSKMLFDPFRRRTRTKITSEDGYDQETTLAQANFFRWAIENGIVDYLQENIEDVERAMSRCRNPEARQSPINSRGITVRADAKLNFS